VNIGTGPSEGVWRYASHGEVAQADVAVGLSTTDDGVVEILEGTIGVVEIKCIQELLE
jgi:hypothetical protein